MVSEKWEERALGLLRQLTFPETWVTGRGGLSLGAAVTILLQIALSCFSLSIVPHIVILMATAVGVWTAWALGREIYWRSGGGIKIGICCESYKVPIDDLIETRREIALQIEDPAIAGRVHLRLLPPSLTASPQRCMATQKKYRIAVILRAVNSPSAEDGTKPFTEYGLHAHIGQQIDEGFARATVAHVHNLMRSSPDVRPRSLKEILRFRASRLFDAILMFAGVIEHIDGRSESASAFLTKLDDRISARFNTEDYPRRAIRFLDCACRLASSVFPGDKPPCADELSDVIQHSQAACDRYRDEFPAAINLHARNLFYARRLPEALALTEYALTHPMNPPDRASASLNLAVLQLLLDQPERSAEGFEAFLALNPLSQFEWKDLIAFADFAAEYGHEAAIFLRALYRKWSGQTVPQGIVKKLEKWIGADSRRNALGLLYHRIPAGKLPGASAPPKKKLRTRTKHKK